MVRRSASASFSWLTPRSSPSVSSQAVSDNSFLSPPLLFPPFFTQTKNESIPWEPSSRAGLWNPGDAHSRRDLGFGAAVTASRLSGLIWTCWRRADQQPLVSHVRQRCDRPVRSSWTALAAFTPKSNLPLIVLSVIALRQKKCSFGPVGVFNGSSLVCPPARPPLAHFFACS